MKRKLWSVGVLGIILLLGVGTGVSWSAPTGEPGAKMEKMEPPMMPGPDGEDEPMSGHQAMGLLNLSEEQLAKLKTERLNNRKQMIRDMAEMKTLHLDLAEETMSDKPDMGKVDKLVKQIGERHTQILLNRTKSLMYLRSLLTPEQKRKMDEMHMQMGPGDRGFFKGQHGRRNQQDCEKKPCK